MQIFSLYLFMGKFIYRFYTFKSLYDVPYIIICIVHNAVISNMYEIIQLIYSYEYSFRNSLFLNSIKFGHIS